MIFRSSKSLELTVFNHKIIKMHIEYYYCHSCAPVHKQDKKAGIH